MTAWTSRDTERRRVDQLVAGDHVILDEARRPLVTVIGTERLGADIYVDATTARGRKITRRLAPWTVLDVAVPR